MRRLILTRHAKSDWQGGATPDRERPLSARGRGAAPRIGAWLATHGHIPDRVLCSDAARTRETWALIAPSLPDAIPVDYMPALYEGGADAMLAAVCNCTDTTVLVLAHNPGIGWLAGALLATPPQHAKFDQYPSGATLVAEFDIGDWHDMRPGSGTVRGFVVPRDLG